MSPIKVIGFEKIDAGLSYRVYPSRSILIAYLVVSNGDLLDYPVFVFKGSGHEARIIGIETDSDRSTAQTESICTITGL